VRRGDHDATFSTLAEALERTLVPELKAIAALAGGPIPAKKAELQAHISAHLAGGRLRGVWESLDALQRAAIAEVVHAQGTRFLADRFAAKYGHLPDFGTQSLSYRKGHATPICFFLYGPAVLPDDLKTRLKEFVAPPERAAIRTLDSLPAVLERPVAQWQGTTRRTTVEKVPIVVHESERRAERELLAVLRLVDSGRVAVGEATRRPTALSVEEIAAVLEGGDFYAGDPSRGRALDEDAGPIRAFAWPLLVQAGGLAERAGPRLRLTAAGRKALAAPPPRTLKGLWHRWIRTSLLDELARIDCVKGQSGKGKHGLTAPSGRREAIAGTLALCPSGRWISMDELWRFHSAAGKEFAVSRSPWRLYLGELQYGSLGYDGAGDILECRYLYCLLLEYAATLGLLDVAVVPPAGARPDYTSLWGADDLAYFSRYDGLLYLRLTALGAHALGLTEEPPAAPAQSGASLRVLPDLEIVAVGETLGHADALALDAYAVRVSDRVWRLESKALVAAVAAGRSASELREFLLARNAGPLPATAARLLDDVEDRCARVHDRGLVRWVECAGDALATEIAYDSRTRRHCKHAGGKFLVVPTDSDRAFRRGLLELGYVLAEGGASGGKGGVEGPVAAPSGGGGREQR